MNATANRPTLYRAVASSGLVPGERKHRHATPRVPINIPPLVDNLWEWLRPQAMPSRRHAVYCSLTPERAIANASAKLVEGGHYQVCEVLVGTADCRLVQLAVADARRHADVTRLPGALAALSEHRASAADGPVARLRAPALSADVLREMARVDPLVAELLAVSVDLSTFWRDASTVLDPRIDGEVFFELIGAASYTLRPLSADDQALVRA